jgi:hypothetical protein
MSTVTEAQMAGLQERVVNIIKSPKTEWPVIEAESTDVAKLYREYICVLAAIPAVCNYIGMLFIGLPTFFGSNIRTSFVGGFVNMVLTYVLALVGVYLSAFIVDKLAPKFESRPSLVQALKLVAYSMTPGWVAGVLMLIPVIGWLGLLGNLYAIYLFYIGLPVMMKTPEDKRIVYMVVSVLVIFVVTFVFGLILAAMTFAGGVAHL